MAELLIKIEVVLPHGESEELVKVIRRPVDVNGEFIGTTSDTRVINTCVYDVEFQDGFIKYYSANVIAENMLSQVDSEGYHSKLLKSISMHSKDKFPVEKKDILLVTKRDNRVQRKTTIVWKFLYDWKDGSQTWVPLKLLKESNPVEVAEYVKARNINDDPAFAWWVPYTLRNRDRIISDVNSRVRKATHKFGIKIPTSIEHCKRLDKDNGNTLWMDSVIK